MDKDLYMTDENLEDMSEDEVVSWLSELNSALRKAGEAGELVMPRISLHDLEKSYESDDYKEFLKESDDTDIAPILFEDEEDVDKINSAYKSLRDLGEGPLTDEKIKAYDDLYASLYPYIKRVNPLWEAGADRLDIWAGLQEEYHTVYTLTPESAAPYRELCSADEYALIGKENILAFGCVRSIEGEDRACGIIIFEIHPEDDENIETVAEIKWLYVDENCRGMHEGDTLMSAMYHALNLIGIRSLCVDIPMRDILPVTLGEFLSLWWINFTLRPRMRSCLRLSRIIESTSGPGHAKPDSYMKMSSVGDELFRKGICSISKNSGESEYILEDTDTLDPDLSVIQLIGGKPQCFILVDMKPSGALKVRRLAGRATDHETYLQLIRFAGNEAAKKYPGDTPVYIEPLSDMSIELYEKLFQDVDTPLYLAGANLSFEGGLSTDTFDEMRIIYEEKKAVEKTDDL